MRVDLRVVVALAFVAGDASAYCRTRTDDLKDNCTLTATECCTQGKVLYWKNACVGYSIQKDASKLVSYDDASQAIAQAFATWKAAPCPSGGTMSLTAQDNGKVSCGAVEYNSDQGNQHVIVFRDDKWEHSDPNNTLALTTLTYDFKTGEIFDADMEINSAQQRMTIGDPVPSDGFDFLSVVTHEVGHFLGLAHSGVQSATMYPKYKPGTSSLRSIAGDDISGICDAYPGDGARSTDDGRVGADACDATPRHGFSTTCGVKKSGGCSVARASGAAAAIAAGADASEAGGLAGAPAEVPTTGLACVAALGVAASFQRRRRRGAS